MVFVNHVVVAHIETVAATAKNIATEANTIVQRVGTLVANLGPVRKVAVFGLHGVCCAVSHYKPAQRFLDAHRSAGASDGAGVLHSRFSGCIVGPAGTKTALELL